jgi:hypothetical protein
MPGKQAHCVQPRQKFVLWHTRWSVGGHTGAGTDRQIGRLALRAAADAVSVASDVAKKTIVLSAPIMRLRMVMAPLPVSNDGRHVATKWTTRGDHLCDCRMCQ